MEFEIVSKDVMGRIGKLKTPSGTVETPTILPVINPSLMTIEPIEMTKYGAKMLITNSYIIYKNKGLKKRAQSEGLHTMLNWDGPIMTDSGSYQLFEYGDIEVTNSEIVKFQEQIGSDIAVPLDIPTPPDVNRRRAEEELKETLKRLAEARKLTKIPMAGPVQGSTFLDLREESAAKVSEIGFDVYPLGGVVPIMEAYRYADLVDIIASSKKFLPPNAPVHLFGAGHPMVFALAVLLGCDLFDSAAYALYAKKGRYLTRYKTCMVEDLHYLPCSCPICSSHDLEDVKKNMRLLCEHNLFVTFEEMRLVKQSLREGNLWELVERRCRSHPHLLSGLFRVQKYTELMEKYDPETKSTFFYLGETSINRPEVLRYSNRLDRYDISGKVLIFAVGGKIKKYIENLDEYDHIFLMKSPFGPYPIELKESYPVGQSEVPKNMDYGSKTVALKNVLRLIEVNRDLGVDFVFLYDKNLWDHPLIETIGRKIKTLSIN